LQIATGLAVLSEPFLPFTSEKLKNILNIKSSGVDTNWDAVETANILLPAEHQLNPSELLFRKIEDAEIQQQLDKLEATKKTNASATQNKDAMEKEIAPQKETITYDDFAKMDMRVGTILEAEKMPKADKLLVLKIDTGLDTRTIVSGIAESFKPEEIIGKKVTVLVNLAPRKLRGVESQGMILMTEDKEGKLVFLNPDERNVDNGKAIS
ncbi:MAG: methionine--tRNA ligase subunit beta, partial [Muricauda sp.]|nr:methionine--tRNA ligase subunit beta [Allomuricauda sp.]